ncbi:hypothetical protein VIBNISFn27_660026 [Vibrio nigripulchritudo SFn27]|uniref:Uncharacterized protein n=1 Tax=Vibrio nigripulchritudo SOn1 TaxID=1238450 RepID=A0AAV2VS10_9VIBR|nr:hypothetical protein VIBNIBLFn1_520074 [Vibrio nigripulchritudo BLFn1]CCN89608.1 hypothetical protein VIBNISFn27_660026 [Vibrio nigripulchritudo SFn27]CCN94434.1 hypothetical protein VIBNIENn2_380074 [Vibrio nigripulchritudo ENn2]CCO47335.1 hypothetical protein VIBNISOn1_30025 [Vibrio nigripulchritudo SOn1]CCO52272.1 hypothetical protein VIBNIWn13_280026 [Vibrio nigripulchritudo Wn13]
MAFPLITQDKKLQVLDWNGANLNLTLVQTSNSHCIELYFQPSKN